jgi:hypothetical protein
MHKTAANAAEGHMKELTGLLELRSQGLGAATAHAEGGLYRLAAHQV